MKYTKAISTVLTLILGVLLAGYHVNNYSSIQDYSIKFTTGQAEGTFSGLKGNVTFDPNEIQEASISVSVEVQTIQTGNTTKDDHARGKKWFHQKKYPLIEFVASDFIKLDNTYKAIGKLTIKNVTKEVVIPFSYQNDSTEPYLKGTLQVNRKDYNIKGNLFGFAVGDNVNINLSIPSNFSN